MFTYPLHLRGLSGRVHTFNVASLGHDFGSRAGVYVLIGRQPNLTNRVLYVGKTNNASDRPGPWGHGHHVVDAARRMGLSAIGFIDIPYERQRDQIEHDLIAGLNPPLNVHHRNPFGTA
jgi:excinuclease UvrABC nuclease subunit